MKGKNCFALMIALLVMLPPANAGTKEELIRLQTDVNTLRDQIRERLAQGQFMEQIVDQVGSKEKTRWQLYQHQHKRNVSRAFAELEWE